MMAIFFPLQGFFNCMIYLRPRYVRCKTRNPDASFRRLMFLIMHHEGHPIHATTTPDGQPLRRAWETSEEERERSRRRRSDTASFYSTGNSKLKTSSFEEGDHDDINTVQGVASVSASEFQYRRESGKEAKHYNNSAKSDDADDVEEPPNAAGDKPPPAEQEMVNRDSFSDNRNGDNSESIDDNSWGDG